MSGAPFPIGSAVASGQYVIVERLHGDPSRGIYRAVSQWAFRNAVVTLSMPQTFAHGELAERLVYSVEGIPELRHVGALEHGRGERGVMVEDEPAGTPVGAAAAGDARQLCLDVGAIAARVHATGRQTVGSLHPELIYAEHGRVTGILPRTDEFLASAEQPHMAPVRLFPHLYTAPEVTARGRVSPAGDVFTLCAIGMHWATGQHPFDGAHGDEQKVAMLIGKRRAPAPAATPLTAVLERGLAARPEQRIGLGTLLEELERVRA